jgi:hypothetical protein
MNQTSQRPFKDLTDQEIERRLEDIETRTKALGRELAVLEHSGKRPGKVSTNLVPEFERLGEEQVGLFQELKSREAERASTLSRDS